MCTVIYCIMLNIVVQCKRLVVTCRNMIFYYSSILCKACNEYTVINDKWQLLPLYMYVCQYNVMYCMSLNLLTVASQPLCCDVFYRRQ